MMFVRIKRRLDDVVFLRKHSADVDVSLGTKLRMWLNGFVSEAWTRHSFDRNDLGEYVAVEMIAGLREAFWGGEVRLSA